MATESEGETEIARWEPGFGDENKCKRMLIDDMALKITCKIPIEKRNHIKKHTKSSTREHSHTKLTRIYLPKREITSGNSTTTQYK